MKKILIILLPILLIALLLVGGYRYLCGHSNPDGYTTIGAIPAPKGFERCDHDEFAKYLRSLPLKGPKSTVKLYTGGDANLQILNYAVVDLPLLSNWEQCADVCIRLNSECLYSQGKYSEIAYHDVNGKLMKYSGGKSRKAFESYLKKCYWSASTYSLSKFLSTRALKDLKPGDVFNYPARKGKKYGHAVMVADVARNKETGEIAFLLVEGNTPARNMHLIRNFKHPFSTPWFYIEGDEKSVRLSPFKYYSDEIRHF